jgi:hypothetical protein
VRTEPTLSQSLHLLNGQTVDGKIQQGAVIRKLLKEGKTPDQVIETIYVRCLCRKPTATELDRVQAALAEEKTPQKALEDIFWAVLNSREFVFNH